MKKLAFLIICLFLAIPTFADAIRHGKTKDGYNVILLKNEYAGFVVGTMIDDNSEFFFWVFNDSLNKAMEHFSWLLEHYNKIYAKYWRNYGEAQLEENGDITYWIYPVGYIDSYR